MTDSLTLSSIGVPAEANSSAKGFWNDEPEPGTPEHTKYLSLKLFLMTSELIEAFEELRNGHAPEERYYAEGGKPEGFLSEMADVMIRFTEFMEHLKLIPELEAAIIEKMAYNGIRPAMHGKGF
jgi:hypothetical protein